ncbi:Premnaspirodiene oxygenase [Heracleum sosnowskyi]|uniref:Premnaspirodiene oxygenase n=1 Tax=Heracleum sosnowskyi TaxID=360622 RepID=A0AAD8M8N6_9APIA|nr:Premnaspirodiene oxygenase [Heracleum sosnowskyi]
MCVLQLLSNKRIQSFQNVRDEEVGLLIKSIKDSSSETVNLRHLFAALSNNIVCRIALGRTFEEDGFCVDKDGIKVVILDMFAAGTETTSTTLEWIMAALIKSPEVMFKLQNEVREIGKGKLKIEDSDLVKMPYLKAVIKESLRLYSPTPLLARQAREDVTVLGYKIKFQTRVNINAWALARDPTLWDCPEEFKTKRFFDTTADYKGLHYEFLPFGAGRRGCPVIQFRMTVVELALANVLNVFEFTLPGGRNSEELDMASSFGINVTKKYPLLVIAKPYK